MPQMSLFMIYKGACTAHAGISTRCGSASNCRSCVTIQGPLHPASSPAQASRKKWRGVPLNGWIPVYIVPGRPQLLFVSFYLVCHQAARGRLWYEQAMGKFLSFIFVLYADCHQLMLQHDEALPHTIPGSSFAQPPRTSGTSWVCHLISVNLTSRRPMVTTWEWWFPRNRPFGVLRKKSLNCRLVQSNHGQAFTSTTKWGISTPLAVIFENIKPCVILRLLPQSVPHFLTATGQEKKKRKMFSWQWSNGWLTPQVKASSVYVVVLRSGFDVDTRTSVPPKHLFQEQER